MHTNFRATMVSSVSKEISQADILPNLNKCIVHLLDLNINLTKEYLISAWSTNSIGSQDFYLANIKNNNELIHLNFTEMFDFQRIVIIKSSEVSLVEK